MWKCVIVWVYRYMVQERESRMSMRNLCLELLERENQRPRDKERES